MKLNWREGGVKQKTFGGGSNGYFLELHIISNFRIQISILGLFNLH